MIIKPVKIGDKDVWLRMRTDLWPGSRDDHRAEIDRYFAGTLDEPLEVLLAFGIDGTPLGFAELNIRNHAEGCETDRVGYLEGWYVTPAARRTGVGRALVAAAEGWAREQGCTEFASDTEIENEMSAAAHRALGFEETARMVASGRL